MTEILNSKQNESEKVFEQYLDSNGFQGKWVYEPSIPGKSKKPDYLLNWKREKHFFEVKELRKKTNEPTTRAAYIHPYSSLRTEINEVRKQFKEYKEYSCSLVVFNVDDRQARLDPLDVFASMLGNLGISADFDAEKGKTIAGSERTAFLDGGKMINYKGKQPQNTTISAIVVLEEFRDDSEIQKALKAELKKQSKTLTLEEKVAINRKIVKNHHSSRVPRVVVVENPFARMTLLEDLFNGPFDERWHWRMQNGKCERVFAGNKLKELEDIKGKS
jgi:hypothetical protein